MSNSELFKTIKLLDRAQHMLTALKHERDDEYVADDRFDTYVEDGVIDYTSHQLRALSKELKASIHPEGDDDE